MQRIFENSNTEWVNFTDYEYRLDNGGEVYIIPTEDSEMKPYTPARVPDLLLCDSLNIGKMIVDKVDMVMVKGKILEFYRHYGPLGFMTAFPLSLEFLDKKSVLLGSNMLTSRDTMETMRYIKLFTPFCENPTEFDEKLRKFNDWFMGRPKVYDIVFSKNYAEKLDWAMKYFTDLYYHFGACYYRDKTTDGDLIVEYMRRIRTMKFNGIPYNFYVLSGRPLQLDYQFPALKSVVDTAYSFAVTNEINFGESCPLKLCKDCEKVFFVSNQRTEFCSVQCRNKYNTRKFRGKGE